MSRLRFNKIATPATPAANKGEVFYSSTLSPANPLRSSTRTAKSPASGVARVGGGWSAGATGAVGGGFAADTYMTGTSVNIGTVGSWKAGMIYTPRSTWPRPEQAPPPRSRSSAWEHSAPSVTPRSSPSPTRQAPASSTPASSRSPSSSAASDPAPAPSSPGVCECKHNLASTGLTSGGTAGYEAKPVASSGFDSTTSNIIGVSFNGGGSFVGTNVMSSAELNGTLTLTPASPATLTLPPASSGSLTATPVEPC
jgi:hypothetical protein